MADAPTKTVDGAAYPKGDFAYTPSDTPSDWSLRLTKEPGGAPDAGIVGAAVAALFKGFRGNKVDIPANDRPSVIRAVRAAWSKANPDKSDDEMPAELKSATKAMTEFDALFEDAPLAFSESDGMDGWQPFTALDFADPPLRIPLLPKPGEYQHPSYGPINVSRERNAHYVSQFKAGVYQNQLPIDAEHQPSTQGAYGWITDMALNDDGSVDGVAEWSDLGEAAIRNNRFKYISPSLKDTWADNYGTSHADIVTGAALTTRPWFKNRALRPMVMNERGTWVPDSFGDGQHDIVLYEVQATEPKGGHIVAENTDMPASVQADTQTYSEADVQAFREQITALTAERDSLKGVTDSQSKQFAELQGEVEALKSTARTARLTDRCQEFYGGTADHLATLEDMARVFGEDSEQVTRYCDQQAKVMKTMKESRMFSEIGTAASPAADFQTKLDLKIKDYQEKHETATYAQALDAVMLRDADLQREYRESKTA